MLLLAFIILISCILFLYLKNKCFHKWDQVDHFHEKKTHTYVYTCKKCKNIKTKTLDRL